MDGEITPRDQAPRYVTVKQKVYIEQEDSSDFTGSAQIFLIAIIALLCLFIVGFIGYCIVKKMRAKQPVKLDVQNHQTDARAN